MLKITLIVAALIILVILFYIFRVQTFVSVMRGNYRKRVDNTNKVNAALFPILLVFGMGVIFWYSYTRFKNFQLPIASKHGVLTDTLFWVTMAITGFVFVLTHILLFWFSYKYQYKEKKAALYYPHNNKLEIVWTVIPAIVLALLVFSGWKAWSNITSPAPKESVVLEVVGKQFAWIVRYPGADGQLGRHDFRKIDSNNEFGLDLTDEASFDDFIANEVHIPKGQPVLFKIRALDVLHSVYIPHFRMKMDAVPGMRTNFWFTPTKTTEEMRTETGNPEFNYKIYCAEICGKGHFGMAKTVIVDEPEDYERWYKEQQKQPWLSKNPNYIDFVPKKLMQKAKMFLPADTASVDSTAGGVGLVSDSVSGKTMTPIK